MFNAQRQVYGANELMADVSLPGFSISPGRLVSFRLTSPYQAHLALFTYAIIVLVVPDGCWWLGLKYENMKTENGQA